jgi:hypothetical protein
VYADIAVFNDCVCVVSYNFLRFTVYSYADIAVLFDCFCVVRYNLV